MLCGHLIYKLHKNLSQKINNARVGWNAIFYVSSSANALKYEMYLKATKHVSSGSPDISKAAENLLYLC